MQHAVTSIDSRLQKYRIYLRVVLHTLGLSIGCTVLFFLARLSALWVYGPLSGDIATTDLWLALWLGLRFDVAIALRVLLLGVLCSLAALALPGHRSSELAWAFNRLLGFLLIFLAIILSATNFAYLGFFGGPLDSFVFEGMEYGFEAAYKSITGVHNVYPTLLATAALLAACLLVYSTFNQRIIEKVSATASVSYTHLTLPTTD